MSEPIDLERIEAYLKMDFPPDMTGGERSLEICEKQSRALADLPLLVAELRALRDFKKRIIALWRQEKKRWYAEKRAMRAAVAKHHSQKADDRCWLDDFELYEAFGLPPADVRVGDKDAMYANCRRFIDQRCEGGGWLSYVDLEREIDSLRDRVGELTIEAREAGRLKDEVADLKNTIKLLDGKLIDREARIAKMRDALDESVAGHMEAKNEIDRLKADRDRLATIVNDHAEEDWLEGERDVDIECAE